LSFLPTQAIDVDQKSTAPIPDKVQLVAPCAPGFLTSQLVTVGFFVVLWD
jgi:hypothetical protein